MPEIVDGQSSRRQFLSVAGMVLTAAGLAACATGGSSPLAPTAARPSSAAVLPGGAGVGTAAIPPGLGLTPGGAAAAVSHGPRDRPRVALTFHLGPRDAGQDLSLAHRLVAEAAELSVPITVFAVGQWLDEHGELVPVILAAGNELANHTYSHPTLTALPADLVAAEIVRCRDVLARLAPTQGRYFRPSGTSTATPLILAEAGAAGYRTVVDFDVDPFDYTAPGADAVVARVRAGARPGSIVSMHFGYPDTVTAFARIVANLRTAGLTPVSVHDLLV